MKKLLVVGGILLLLVLGGCAAIVALVGGAANEVVKEMDRAKNAKHAVVYEVGGTATKADITFSSDGSTGTSQDNGARVPWRKKITVQGESFPVFQVMAQNNGAGIITCKITVDGKVVKENRSKGEYAIASCDATLD